MKPTFHLPDTELTLSPLIFGTTRAGIAWEGKDADAILDAYLDMGGNAIDTARVYSPPRPGYGEHIIGGWLRKRRREDVVLITKGGHPPLRDMSIRRTRPADMAYDLDTSLDALCTDYIDLYLYHRDDPDIPVGELLEQMELFRCQGKIRYYGCSNWSTERMQQADDYAAAHGLRGFAANQVRYNAGTAHMQPSPGSTMLSADEAMLRYHQSSRNTLMAYSSICNGFFHRLAAGEDQVQGSKYLTDGNRCVARRLQALCEAYHATLSQVLLGYLLTRPVPVLPLVGASTIVQLRDAMTAADIPFRPEDFAGL